MKQTLKQSKTTYVYAKNVWGLFGLISHKISTGLRNGRGWDVFFTLISLVQSMQWWSWAPEHSLCLHPTAYKYAQMTTQQYIFKP